MHIFQIIKTRIVYAIESLLESKNSLEVSIEIPKNSEHGDVSTNAAMVISKFCNDKPAERLVKIMREDEILSDIIRDFTIAGPGFINMYFKEEVLHKFLFTLQTLQWKAFESDLNIGKNKKINIEFVSANPTGPMHIGHARSAIFGDVMCRLFRACGFDVTAEYYMNDAGSQIDTLVKSLYIRYRQLLGDEITIPDDCYPGEYLIDAAQKLKNERGDDLKKNDPYVREFAINEMMSLIKSDLEKLRVKHDIFTSEAELVKHGMVEKAIKLLESKGLIYYGTLEQPKGQTDDDWEPREQLLFESTKYGDDSDRAILKSDGTYSYFASDVALHYDKLQREYSELFLLLGADHAGYITRIRAAVKAMSDGKVNVNVIINQLVNIYKNGKPIRMSKRKGNFVTVDDLLNELSQDILRFAMLTQKNGTVIDLDCDKLVEKSKDNPFFYIQYAHTRVCSILRNAYKSDICSENEIFILEEKSEIKYFCEMNVDFSVLKTDLELNLIKLLVQFPRVIELSVNHIEPHRIAYYLYELANKLHSLWHAGVESESMKCVIKENILLSRARVALVHSVALVIYYGLKIIGVKPLLEM